MNTNENANVETTVKNENVSTAKQAVKEAKKSFKEVAKKTESKLTEINLDRFAKALESFDTSKVKNQKQSFYIYPESFNQDIINGLQGKHWRNKRRSDIERFCNNIFIYAKTKDVEKLKVEVKNFVAYYKEYYKINDFTSASLSQSPKPIVLERINFALEIIKEMLK